MACYKEAVIRLAENEIGYLEKASNGDLDSKTGNAGTNNYTKYWRDVAPSLQGSYWCACFISWLFMKAYGRENAERLLLHYPYVLCQEAYQRFKSINRCYSQPCVGDIVVFWNGARMHHTGLVVAVSGNTYTTIEGNTSGGSSVVPNGGGVAKKNYSISMAVMCGHKFLRPYYDVKATVKTKDCSSTVKRWQKLMNRKYRKLIIKYCGELLYVDGEFGVKSKRVAILVWKYLMDKNCGSELSLANGNFFAKCKKESAKCVLKLNDSNQFVLVLKGLLAGEGLFSATVLKPLFGKSTFEAVKKYQTLKNLEIDGIVGKDTWSSLIGTK